ncbi:MAG: DUF637 domain-containing protein [Alphaproteobacteria bacterium]|nr:DUF637 domain-containing protein [Alphaproteobacteria bacterium]
MNQTALGDWTNNNSTISSIGNMDLSVGGLFTNSGELSTLSTLSISAYNILNQTTGMIASDEDADIQATNNLTNQGVVYATNNLALHVGNTLLNNQAYILTTIGNVVLDGIAGGRMVLLNNQSGLIESAGSMVLKADTIINERAGGTNITQTAADTDYFDIRYGHGNDDMLAHTGSDNQWLIFNAAPYEDGIKFMVDNNSSWQADPNLPPGVARQIITESENFTQKAGEIISGQNLTIDSDTLQQSTSAISASGNVDLGDTNIINTGMSLNSIIRYTCTTSGCLPHLYNPLTGDYDYIGGVVLPMGTFDLAFQSGHIASTIEAGGNLTAGGTLINNLTSLPTSAVVINPEIDQISSVLPNTGISASGLFGPSSNPNSPYLIQTNIPFVNNDNYVGSNYLLTQLGYQLEQNLLILGDAFFETHLIRDQMLKALGTRFLIPGLTDETAQMKHLYDNALSVKDDLNLSVGLAPTDSQLSLLNKDIIWLVQETVNGKQVLVPHLYLAQSTVQTFTNTNNGSMIAGNNVNFNGTSIINQGSIRAKQNMVITASGAVVNEGGTLGAGNNLSMTAETIINSAFITDSQYGKSTFQTLQHQGTITAGNDVTLTANKDIVFQGGILNAGHNATLTSTGGDIIIGTVDLIRHTEGKYHKSTSTSDSIQRIGSQLSTGNDLILSALSPNASIDGGGNITISGSVLDAGHDMNLDANNLNITSAADYYHSVYDGKSGGGGFMGGSFIHAEKELLTNKPSILTAGHTINASAADTMYIASSNLTANDEINLSANTLLFGAEKDVDYLSIQSSKDNGIMTTMIDQGHHIETVKQTKLQAGTVNLSANSFAVQYEGQSGETLTESVDRLKQEPGLEWLGQLQQQNNVAWEKVDPVYQEWYHKTTGLSAPAAAVIAIAVAAATGGTGATLIGAAGSSVSGLMANAAFSTLVTQASIALINNKGNILGALEDMGSSANLKQLAISVVSAGITGVSATILT